MTRYTPEPYKPDGGFSLAGLPVLFFVLFVAAGAIGGLASFLGQWFYLVLLFPVGMGLALTAVGYLIGRVTKMRSVGIAILAGLISGAVSVVTMHYGDYLRFRDKVNAIDPAGVNFPRGVDAAQFRQLVQAMLQKKGVDTFLGYMNQQATEGVTIGGRRGGGFNLGFTGSWIYWALELVVVAVITCMGIVGGTAAPFCSVCDRWKEERKLGTLDGDPQEVKTHLEEGDLQALRDYPTDGELHLSVHVCPGCGDEGDLAVKLQQVTKNAKGEDVTTALAHLTYPGKALADLEAVFTDRDDDEEEEEALDAKPGEPQPSRHPADDADDDAPRRRI